MNRFPGQTLWIGVPVLVAACAMFEYEGHQRGVAECSAASARAEAAALDRAAHLERMQMAEQAKATAAVQAQKTATGAALTGAQWQIREMPPRPHACDIGPAAILKLNALRGQP